MRRRTEDPNLPVVSPPSDPEETTEARSATNPPEPSPPPAARHTLVVLTRPQRPTTPRRRMPDPALPPTSVPACRPSRATTTPPPRRTQPVPGQPNPNHPLVAAGLLALNSIAVSCWIILVTTIRQIVVPAHLLGRVSAADRMLYALSFPPPQHSPACSPRQSEPA